MASVAKVAVSKTQIDSTVPPPETRTAAHAALFTRELLCNIVARLPFQGVLAATGVCREWRAAIVGDPNIREGLLLKPAEVRLVLAHEKYMRETEKVIPLNECCILGTPLPFLHRIFDKINFAVENKTPHINVVMSLKTPKSLRRLPTSVFDTANNFWRDMFIAQPSCSNVHISTSPRQGLGHPFAGGKMHDIELRRADGIKLGDFYDTFHSHLTGDYNQFSIVLTVRDWIPAAAVSDKFAKHVRCEVHNGEVRRPTPARPTTYDDYFNLNLDFDDESRRV